jgi:hypothetical protein
LKQELAQTRWFAGHPRIFMSRNPQPGRPPVEGTSSGPASMGRLREGRNEMHPEDLMKPDLLSEIVLLGSGALIFVSLLLIVVTALTRA